MGPRRRPHPPSAAPGNADEEEDDEAIPLLQIGHGAHSASSSQSAGSPDSYNPSVNEGTERGVAQAAAARSLANSNVYLLWSAWLGIGLVSYVNGLDNQTMYQWMLHATNEFGTYATSYTTISVVQQVLIGVMKLPIARLADVLGRAQTFCLAITCYTLGFLIIALAPNMATLWIGVSIYATGNTGAQILQQIVIADWVPTRFRGLAIGLISTPYIINFVAAPKIAKTILEQRGWRWGPGFMAIVVPLASMLIISVLAISQYRANVVHLPSSQVHWLDWRSLSKVLDLPGLGLVIVGWLPILLAVSTVDGDEVAWEDPKTFGLVLLGLACLALLVLWEAYCAQEPLLRSRCLTNRDVMLPMLIGAADFFAFYCSWVNALVWSRIVTDWDDAAATYFANTQSLALTIFGILGGMLSVWSLRYKWQMFGGACLRSFGIGLMLYYRGAEFSTVQLILPQIIQGAGGGIMGVQLQVAAQVSVAHVDVATVTATIMLVMEIGGAIGSAVAGAVQNSVLPMELVKRAPDLSSQEVVTVTNSPLSILDDPAWGIGSPNRAALQGAYARYWHVVLSIAFCMSIVPILCTALLRNWKLNASQTLIGDDGCPDRPLESSDFAADEPEAEPEADLPEILTVDKGSEGLP